jgi:transposase
LDTQKKTLRASERDEIARAAFRERIAQRSASDFVIFDECGSNLNLTPLYARAPQNERAYGSIPRNTPEGTTLMASLSVNGIGPALIMPGATDRLAMEAYVEHILAPSLREGQIVLMDNLSAHKGTRVAELIEACGCELWFLPSYSPDLSPIEQAFAKLKSAWRRAEARSVELLYETIIASLPSITASDARSFFRDCGYQIHTLSAQPM